MIRELMVKTKPSEPGWYCYKSDRVNFKKVVEVVTYKRNHLAVRFPGASGLIAMEFVPEGYWSKTPLELDLLPGEDF